MSADILLAPAAAERLAGALLGAAGATPANAETVAAHLVDAELAGMRSHGLQRVPQYVAEIERGEIAPAARPVVEGSGSLRRVNGRRTFGQVAAVAAVQVVERAAREHGVALVTVHEAGHAGRIGAYVESLANAGLVALAFCSGPRSGHRVAPFGGRAGRLATNPISWAAPSAGGEPPVADLSTSTTAEGQVRLLRELGRRAPAGMLRTAAGEPTDDPADLYTDPPGTIEPLGGELYGYKGTALALLVEVMATLLAGEESDDGGRVGNNLALLAIRGDARLGARVDRLASYVRSSPTRAGIETVQMPGDRERAARRAADGVAVPGSVWRALEQLGQHFGVPVMQG